MKTTITSFLILLSFLYSFSQTKTLDNSDIIEMSKSNLSTPIILSAIENTSKYNFDISTKGLKQLSENKVDDEIVVLMMKKQNNQAENFIKIDGLTFSKNEYGLFINENNKKVKIPSHLTQVDFGIKLKAQIPNPTADIQINNKVNEFYFNFGINENNTTNSTFNLTNSISDPNEGELVILSQKRKKREIQVGKAKLTGIKNEIPAKKRIEYSVKKIKHNLYKITIQKQLEPGEYGFIFGAINGGASMKIYDFSVK